MSHKTTSLQTLMHLINGYVGSGILAMPRAFADGGLVIASIGTPLIGLLSNICIHMLVEMNEHLCQKLNLSPLDYEELAENAFIVGPKSLKKYSRHAKLVTSFFIIITQLGGCCVYYLFIADNIKYFLENLEVFGSGKSISIEIYLSILLPIMILLNCVKSIKHLSIASVFANILQLVGLVIIVYNLVSNIPPVSNAQRVGQKLPLFFVTTLFIFEGISVSMPLYKSMKEPKDFGKRFGVLNIAIILVISFNFLVGFLGYIKYGDSVAPVITLSLPKESLYISVQFLYGLAVMLTYPIILYVPIEMLWPTIETKLKDSKKSSLTIALVDYSFRAGLVIITFALSALIPELDLIISLVGSITSSSIAIIIPSVLHTIAFWNEKNKYSRLWLCARNMSITLIGVLGFVLGTYFSIDDIVKALSHGYS